MNLTSETTPIKGLTKAGDTVWYTGRAGEGWVSSNPAEAFKYTVEGARRKASVLNRMTDVHGVLFVAVVADPHPTPLKVAEWSADGQPQITDGSHVLATIANVELAHHFVRAVNAHDDLVAAANQMVRVFHCHCDTEGCRQCAAHVEMSQILANLANTKVVA